MFISLEILDTKTYDWNRLNVVIIICQRKLLFQITEYSMF